MKKHLLKLATAGLFVGALLFSLSATPGGKISLFKKAHASEETWRLYYAYCPNGNEIVVCGAGGAGCTPYGNCDDN
jgi:hypothetical protein